MNADRNARLGALGGIVAVVLFLVGFGLVTSGAPSLDSTGDVWAKFFSDHRTRIQIGITIIGVGLFFFIWFLGSLRTAMGAAEGDSQRLASIAFGAGLVGATILLVGITATATAAFRPGDPDSYVTQALSDFGVLVAGPGAAAFTAFSAAMAIAGYRHGALPAPVAGFSALSAITQPLAYGVVFTTSGAFAGDGVLGAYVPVLTFSIAVITASWALYRGHTPAAAASTSR
jgi:hypothetical protein